MVYQISFSVTTRGRGTYTVLERAEQGLADSGIQTGIGLIFVHHTSASLILCENADPDVRADLDRFMARLVPGRCDFSARRRRTRRHAGPCAQYSDLELTERARPRRPFRSWAMAGYLFVGAPADGQRRRLTLTVHGD